MYVLLQIDDQITATGPGTFAQCVQKACQLLREQGMLTDAAFTALNKKSSYDNLCIVELHSFDLLPLPIEVGSKVLYQGNVYYVRSFYPNNKAGLAQSIDGKPTLIAKIIDLQAIKS